MKKTGSYIKYLLVGVFFAFWIFLGLKHFILRSLDLGPVAVYKKLTDLGGVDCIYVVSRDILIFSKTLNDRYEYAAFKVNGQAATHYFGPFYNSGESLLNIQKYNDAINVWAVNMELRLKNGNVDKSTFGDVGRKFKSILVSRANSISIGEDAYTLGNLSSEEREFIVQVYKNIKSQQ